MNSKHYILLVLLAIIMTACRQETEAPAQLQLRLCLPIQERAVALQNRMPGDPGTAEAFALPKYAYVLVMKQTGVDTWTVWKQEEMNLAEDSWERTRYYGRNASREDSIYLYNKPLQYLLKNETPTGRVYAICSNMKLTFNQTMGSISSLTDLLDWNFDSSPDSIQENLQNIYSTPYNYIRDGKYYCSFDCSSGGHYTVDLIMYHIASKVDIKWNVVDSVRIYKSNPSQAVRLTYMDALNLYTGNAYCFRPMENEAAAVLNTGRTVHMVTPADEGLWWEGRAYFYTIPYTVTGEGNYFPLQMLMRTNGSSDDYKPTLRLKVDTDSPFVPWLRANFNLSKPLEAGETTKIVDN